jgi:hypothetical protein
MFQTLIAGGLGLLLSSAGQVAADHVAADVAAEHLAGAAAPSAVSRAVIPVDALPTPAMARQFAAYLAWTKREGLSRLAAFERLADPEIHASRDLAVSAGLPTAAMTEQFEAYLRWTREQDLGRFHAFNVSSFD